MRKKTPTRTRTHTHTHPHTVIVFIDVVIFISRIAFTESDLHIVMVMTVLDGLVKVSSRRP